MVRLAISSSLDLLRSLNCASPHTTPGTLHIVQFCSITVRVDLPQVDLMNFRVEYVRPQGGRCLGREAAERATKSREGTE